MGHFIRTLALAEMLKDDFQCIYATISPSSYQINEIKNICSSWINLPDNLSHFNIFLNLLEGNEIVVLDNYYYTSEYQLQIKEKGCKLVCIDDLHEIKYYADIVINHAEGLKESSFMKEPYTKLCLGYKYALLRKEYLKKTHPDYPKIYSCMVMMGGVDPYHLTYQIIKKLQGFHQIKTIAVIVGSGYQGEDEFNSFPNIKVFKGIDSQLVFRIMQESVFGVLPASTVAIEACAARLPFICGYFIDNQKELYNGIKNNNLAVCIGDYRDSNPVIINQALDAIEDLNTYHSIERLQKSMLDKKSNVRIVKIFSELCL